MALLIFYYGTISFSLKFCDVNFIKILREEWRKIFLVVVISLLFIFFEVSLQQTIYIWDSLETYEPTILCEEATFTEPLQALKNLYFSINHLDYNFFLPMLMVLPMHIFGKSFLAYNFYVWIMFAIPAIFLTAAAIKNFLAEKLQTPVSCATILFLLLIIPHFEVPLLIGYANVSILLPGIIIWLMLLNLDRENFQRPRLFLIAVLSIFAVIQSRTAAYMLIGCFAGYAAYCLYLAKNFRAELKLLCKKFLFIGLTAAALISLTFFPFIKHALTYDIGTAYSAYALGQNFFGKIFNHIAGIGLILYIMFALGIAAVFFNKEVRPYFLFAVVWIAATVLLFCRVQNMGWQHFNIMLLPLSAVIVTIVAFCWETLKKFTAALILLLIVNFAQVFTGFSPVQFNWVFLPPVRNDIADLKNFVADIKEISAGRKIYFVASSGLYNATTLQKISVPETHYALPNLIWTADVDLRDGFPIEFFDAEIVIVAEPVQIHLLPENQSVVVGVAYAMLNPTNFSAHFKLIREQNFSPAENESVTFKVYEKISPFDKSDIDIAEKYFEELYPYQPKLFKNRFEQYKKEHFGE